MPFDESYFSTNTYKGVSTARYSQYWWSNRFYAQLARRYGCCGGRLLEIGSGLGHLAGQLEQDFETYAMDVNLWALQESRKAGIKTRWFSGSAEAPATRETYFDVIIMKHIVEHLANPETALIETGRICAAGGILILSTPNLSSLLKPWKGERWIGYQDPTHITLKEPDEWLDLIRKSGFTLLKVFSDGFWDVPYIRLVPAPLQKLFFGAPGGIQAMCGIPFLPLRWGESVIVIARKKGGEV